MNRILATIGLVALASSVAIGAGVGTYMADPVHSSANFTAVHLGISHVNGIIPIKSVTLEVPDASNIPVHAVAVFDPAGVDTRNSMRDGDLRSPHFFDVATYPDMRFTSTKIVATDATHFTMTGDLLMHGQTHPVTLAAQYLGRMTDQRGRTHVAYEAKTSFDRSEWGMTWGSPFAGDSIDVTIDVEAIENTSHR